MTEQDDEKSTGNSTKAQSDQKGGDDTGMRLGTPRPSEKEMIRYPLSEYPIRTAYVSPNRDKVTTHLSEAILTLTDTDGPVVVVDYTGDLTTDFAQLVGGRYADPPVTGYLFQAPDSLPAIPLVDRRSFDLKRPIDEYTKQTDRPAYAWGLPALGNRDDFRPFEQSELAYFIDVFASGRSQPTASFAELERSLDTTDPDALLEESGDQMIFNPTARQSSNPYYEHKSYLDSYLPSVLEELRTIEQSTFNVFEDFGSDAVLLFDVSELSSYAQCVLSDLLAWKLYCDMRVTGQDIKNQRLSLVLNEPYSAGNPGLLPYQEPGPLSSVDWDMGSKDGFVVDLCLGANPARELNMWQIHRFNTQIYQGDLNEFTQSDDVRPDDIPEGPFRDAMNQTTGGQHQVIVTYDEPGGSKSGALITEPSFDGYAAGEHPPTYGAASGCLERFNQAAQEYLASEAPETAHWSIRSDRPAASKYVERADSTGWHCTICDRHYWEYEDAVTCHDPGVFEKYRNCDLPIQFTLPPAVLSRKTTTGQSLDEAIAELHSRNHERPTDVVEALEVLEFVRVGGLPSYLRNGTEDLVEQIRDALTPAQANEFTELITTRSLSRRTYHTPTDEGRSRLTVSARVPDVRVVDSSIRHNGILSDTARLLSTYDDVAWTAAPYYGLPNNGADIVAFDDDWSIQYLVEIMSTDDEEVDQEPIEFNSLIGGTHHLYVCQHSDLVRQLINAYTNDTVPDRRFSASKPITGDYYIGDLRKRFLEIDHDELHPITTHRVVEDNLKEIASSPQSQ